MRRINPATTTTKRIVSELWQSSDRVKPIAAVVRNAWDVTETTGTRLSSTLVELIATVDERG
jgi:hypothetical protein